MKKWFEVSCEGLAQLQKGKPKTFIINEICQNSLDENITFCKLDLSYYNGFITLTVEDDSPEGFKDLTHAYTLFADTYKRRDPTKRGKFNLGEKFVISICKSAEVSTTKGTVVFDDEGRHQKREKRTAGSVVTLIFRATKEDLEQLIKHANLLLPPTTIKFIVNGQQMPSKTVFKTFEAILDTETLVDDVLSVTKRKTAINVIQHDSADSYVYEMGIPIAKTDCPWHIDVQQKILMSTDREHVRPSYLQDLYAEVLNNTYEAVDKEEASRIWVRTATKDERIKKEAVKTIADKRFGDKWIIANPFDPVANDDAVAQGYHLVGSTEMSGEERDTLKKHDMYETTTDAFGKRGIETEEFDAQTPGQRQIKNMAIKIAKNFLGIDIEVSFIKELKIGYRASYEPSNKKLTFNLARLPSNFFDNLTWQNLDLIVHEIAHDRGLHTEESYHVCITELAGKLTMKALGDPEYFKLGV